MLGQQRGERGRGLGHMGFLHVAVGPLTAFQQRVPPERDNYPHTAVIPTCAEGSRLADGHEAGTE